MQHFDSDSVANMQPKFDLRVVQKYACDHLVAFGYKGRMGFN